MKKVWTSGKRLFLYNHRGLLDLLKKLNNKKIILFGVSFALLDFADFVRKTKVFDLAKSDLVIMKRVE